MRRRRDERDDGRGHLGDRSAQQAAQATQQSMAALSRATLAVQAMQAVQNAARNLALSAPSAVPNGLVPGGLVVDPSVTFRSDGTSSSSNWVNANAPSSTTSNGVTTITIDQTAAHALLTWAQFNIGKNTIVDFNQQGNTSWVALNKIAASGVPSQILGSINASGSVYIINQNGIVFGGSSQVNVHTLIASALDLNDPGYANFLAGNGIFINTPTFQGGIAGTSIWAQAGAQINATGGQVLLLAPTVQNDGAIYTPSGQTLLLGGSDVLLTAGNSYVRGFIVTPNSTHPDPNLPANLVTNQPTGYYSSSTPGTVINDGSISAPRGNITFVAGQIAQNGVLTSTTSTTQNGSIIMRAESGTLLLGGPNDNPLYAEYGIAAQPSLLQIIPDSTDQSLITDTQALANSSISLTGVNVDIRGIVQLHGYDLINPITPTNSNDPAAGITITATGGANATGQVLLGSASLIDGSGTTDATASASRNSVAVELRSNELANSPLVEAGPLYQQTIYVDASASGTYANGTPWQGTPLANASGWIALTTRSLDERMMNGAPINIGGAELFSSTLVVGQLPVNFLQMPGSTINISGGYLTYTPGFVQVSMLINAYGQLVSASAAAPNAVYAGVCCSFTVSNAHWGTTEIYRSPLTSSGYFSPGYVQGGAGGSLTLLVQAAVLGGQIDATVVSGVKQRTLATAPSPAALTIDNVDVLANLPLDWGTAYSAGSIVLSDTATATAAQWAAGFTVGADLNSLLTANAAAPNSVYMPSSWLNSGLGNISLAANNTISLSAGNPVNLPAGGSFSATANSVDIESSITAPGGTITLAGVYTTAAANPNNPPNNPNGTVSAYTGLVTLGAGVTLSAAGAWTNDANGAATVAIATNGGKISISSTGNIDLGQGSVLDVSGGAYELATHGITAGNGGTLQLAAGVPLPLNSNVQPGTESAVVVPLGIINFGGGALVAGQLKGYGVGGSAGGSLSLTSYSVATIGTPSTTGGALMVEPPAATDFAGNVYHPLAISTDFFSAGGFSNISLTAAGITLPADVTLAPTVSSLALTNLSSVSQSSLAGIATPTLLPQGVRPAASISLHASGDLWNRGIGNATAAYQQSVDVAMYSLDIAGTIETDPKGSVNLIGDQIAIVSGIVDAPAGTITLGGGTYSYVPAVSGGAYEFPTPLNGEGVWLTASGELLAAGTQIAVPQSGGLPYRDVLPGGQVTVSGGDIILAPRSLIDVSGVSGVSSLAPAGSGSAGFAPLTAPNLERTFAASSAGGAISISAVLGGVLEGTLLGESGGANAAGGTLSVSLAAHPGGNQNNPFGYWPTIENTYIILQQSLQPGDSDYVSGAALQPGNNPAGTPTAGDGPVATPTNDAILPVSAAMFSQGGFASLMLNTSQSGSVVTFRGSTTLTVPGQFVIENTGTIVVPSGVTAMVNANYVQWSNAGAAGAAPAPLASVISFTQNVPVATGLRTLTVQQPQAGLFYVGETVTLVDSGNGSKGTDNSMSGTVVSFNPASGALVVNVSGVTGSGPVASWTITPYGGTGILTINAATMDLVGNLAVQGAQRATFNVAGDLRLTGAISTSPSGSLVSYQELDFAAAQIYPTTDTTFTLASASTISFTANGTPPQAPLSVGGTLNVYAPEIDQSGTLRAPTGSIALGSTTAQAFDGVSIASTQTLNLGAGSFTSVSTDGETALYGYVQNGTAWYYSPEPSNQTISPITAPPAKLISLAGQNISVASGAAINESGGGDLYAGEFVPGTGGSLNIFIGQNKNFAANANVYAVMPGYTGITPYDPSISLGGPVAGKQVYLSGIPGLPAGTYTLLPSQYAELPGAFLITVNSAPGTKTVAVTQTPIGATALPSGSYLVSGYLTTPGAGTTDEHWSVFQVLPDAAARRYTEIDNYNANTFFATQAAANGTAVPRLPQDAGQFIIAATGSLNFQGTGNFAHPNGLGGLADISANQILVVDNATAEAIAAGTIPVANYAPGTSLVGGASDPDGWNPIVLGAGELNQIGVESLLLGGARSFQSDGVHFTAVASAVVVANENNPLVLPDIQLIAKPDVVTTNTIAGSSVTVDSTKPGTGQVIIAPNAVVEASGPVAPGEPTIYWMSASTLKAVPVADALDNEYNASDIQAYYQAVAANQIGYVRISGGGLVTMNRGNANYSGLPPAGSDTSSTGFSNWGGGWSAGTDITLTASGKFTSYAIGQWLQVTGSGNGQTLTGFITAINGNALTVQVFSHSGSGASTSARIAIMTDVGGAEVVLPNSANSSAFAINGSVTVGGGARLISDNSLTLFASGSSILKSGVTISAQQAELKSTQINLGTDNYSLQGLVLDQAALDGLAGVNALTLISTGTINLYGGLSLGILNAATGQPVMGSLTLDSAGLVEMSTAGTATFTAEQVILQNSLGGTVTQTTAPVSGTALAINAIDVLGVNASGQTTGYNNAQILLGGGSVTVAGFGSVDLRSSGQIVVTGALQSGSQIVSTGNAGTLNVESPLTLDAPRISGGILTTNPATGLPELATASYTITAADNPANPGTYYPVSLINSSGATPVLPTALLGNTLTINAGQTTIDTSVVLPGGTFSVTANGNLTVGPQGVIDVSGQAIQFVDVLATIGGGNITLSSPNGTIAIQAGAVLNVGDLADVGALNKTSAGTLTLSAPLGGVTIAGTLLGQGPTADSGGSFVLDTNTLAAGTPQTYDALAAALNAGGFTASWNIRARTGDIDMTGITQARNVTVSADTGNIDISGTINASGDTPGMISIWAGNNLTVGIQRRAQCVRRHGQCQRQWRPSLARGRCRE